MKVERIEINQALKPSPDIDDGSSGINALKTIAEQSAMLSNLAMSNLVSNNNRSQQNTIQNQGSINQVFMTTTAQSVNLVNNLSPIEARSSVEILTEDEVAQSIADLSAVVKLKTNSIE